MGCCLFACIGAIWPRITLVCLWIFTQIPSKVFEGMLWPLLGFFFLPTTTLAFELCRYYPVGPVHSIEGSPIRVIIVVVAFLHDLGQLGMFKGLKDDQAV